MFSQRFRLKTATIAASFEDGKERVLYIPAGAEIVVTGSLSNDGPINREVSVEWEGNTLTMFAVDILERGERVRGVTD
jgi:hypothetical protein